MVNTVTNKVSRILGKDENNRFLDLSLFQGTAEKQKLRTIAMATSDNPLLNKSAENDPILFCTAFKRSRFYLFGQQEPERYATHLGQCIRIALTAIASVVMPIRKASIAMSSTRSQQEKNRRLQPCNRQQIRAVASLISPFCTQIEEISISVCFRKSHQKRSRILSSMRGKAIMMA